MYDVLALVRELTAVQTERAEEVNVVDQMFAVARWICPMSATGTATWIASSQ